MALIDQRSKTCNRLVATVGVVVHYEATALPIERGRTGFHAFCTDDSASLWYDDEGSVTKCLASHRVLHK